MSKGCECCAIPGLICRAMYYFCLGNCSRMKRRGTVHGSEIKKSELQTVFSEISKKSGERKITTRILSEEGNLAYIIAVRVQWTNESSSEAEEFVLKTIDFDRCNLVLAFHPRRKEVAPILRQFMMNCHNSECASYEFLKRYDNMLIPKIYFTRHASTDLPGMIIMENLTRRAKSESLCRGLDLQQMLSVVETLAQIHVASLRDDTWRAGVADDAQAKHIFLVIFGAFTPIFPRVKGAFPEKFSHFNVEKCTELCTSEKYMENLYCHRGKLPDVLVHGDLLPTNVMFELLPDGTVGSKVGAVIDWQLARAGNPLDDIAKLLSWGAQADVFDQQKDTILQRYFDIMKAEVPDKFQVTYDELKSVMWKTLAAHSLQLPALLYLFKFRKGATAAEKADRIKKAVLAYDFACEVLF